MWNVIQALISPTVEGGTWMSNYTLQFFVDIITYPFPNLDVVATNLYW